MATVWDFVPVAGVHGDLSAAREPPLQNRFLSDDVAAIVQRNEMEHAVEIRQDDPTAPHVADLLAHHLRELRAVMADHAFALDASGLSAAGVTFWTAWDGGALVGFGALKALGPAHGEVKSMRASPAARGRGVGRALLEHIVGEARRRGYEDLSLETGTATLHAPAISLYRRAGFVPCDAFADYRPSPYNQFFRLVLTA